jgi:hypothetical protein
MTISAIMFILAGLLLSYLAYKHRRHNDTAEKLMTSLATPTLLLTHSDDTLTIREYVVLHPQVSSKELATLYSVSLRTAQRAIKNINLNK